jgi:hypothetical protein
VSRIHSFIVDLDFPAEPLGLRFIMGETKNNKEPEDQNRKDHFSQLFAKGSLEEHCDSAKSYRCQDTNRPIATASPKDLACCTIDVSGHCLSLSVWKTNFLIAKLIIVQRARYHFGISVNGFEQSVLQNEIAVCGTSSSG